MKTTHQNTLRKSYSFEGKGLHTGRMAKVTLNPAPADSGIVFRRIDISQDAIVEALAEMRLEYPKVSGELKEFFPKFREELERPLSRGGD